MDRNRYIIILHCCLCVLESLILKLKEKDHVVVSLQKEIDKIKGEMNYCILE